MTEAMIRNNIVGGGFLDDIRALSLVPGQTAEVERIPSGRVTLIFRALENGTIGDLWVAGPHTQAIFKSKVGIATTVALRLKPGWSGPVLGVATNELTDQVVPLDAIWGRSAHELLDLLLATRTPIQAMERMSRAVALHIERHRETASGRLARRAARLLDDGDVRVESVAHHLGVTVRHLRRTFTENVGVGPKEFARTARLQRALRMAEKSRDWARIAADAGYYDQAHLISDFRQLVGLTPGAYLARREQLGPDRFVPWT